jgi:para-nitrobenzyl esterase
VRSADKFGSSSVQFAPPPTSIYSGGETEFSEDCLYLNIYTGPEGSQDRPVLVWIHFGAFLFGSASNPVYDGTKLAAKGITVVNVNHRLGRFGFLAHPELSAESGYNGSGNYGIMDQIAALEWVQRNIKAFGGDPGNVTIGGASAGGGSTHILRGTPLAKNLFSKVICESGPGVAPEINGLGHVAGYTTLAAAEEAGTDLLNHVGVSSIAELRKIPAKQITSVHLPRSKGPWKADIWPGTSSLSMFDTANPNIDGYVLPESPLSAFVSGRAADVPLLAGNVGNEASGLPYLRTLAEYHDHVKNYFGEHFEEVLRLYPASTDSEVRAASSQILADQVFIYPTWSAARFSAKNQKSAVWYYLFTRAPPIPADADVIEKERAGAFHVAGIPYGFETLDARPWDWTDDDRVLSRQFSDAWVQFVKTGNPNGSGEEHADSWPALKSSGDLTKIWDIDAHLEPVYPRVSKMTAFLDKFYGVAV